MTASVTPEPAAAPRTPVGPDAMAGIRTPEASPPRRRRTVPILLSIAGSLVGLVFGVIALLGLFGSKVVDSSAVASQIQSHVSTGVATCSEDLPATVGASISCSVLDGADTYSVRATVTSVDGDDVRFDLEQG